MPRPPSDVFRPRLPLDPFAAVDVRAPWLVPPNLPHSPPQVILILGEPPPSELLPLLTSPHLARSLLLIASHAPPALPLLPPTTPGPTVRILHLAAPLAIHNAGALRLVALLEKAHRVAARWRLQVSSSSHHALSHPHLLTSASSASLASSSWGGGAGPSKHRGGGGGGAWSGPGSAADRVVQLAESLKTGEFSIVELVVYLPPPPTSFPPTTTATSAAADAAGAWSAAGPGGVGPPAMKMMSSADPRSRDNKPKPKNTDNNRHQGPSQIQGSGTPARSSPTALPTPQIPNPSLNVQRPGGQHHQPEDNAHRYPSPAPSVTESLSSSTTSHAAPSASLGARPKLDSGSVSKNSKRFLTLSPSSTTPDISPPSTPSRPTSSYSVSSFLSANGAQQASGKPRKLRRNSRSSTSSLSVSSSMSHSTHNNAAASISPFAAPHPTEAKRGSSYSKSKKGAKDALGGESGRAFDAILNFLPAGVPDKQLLKHAILVTTLGVRYLESEDLGHHHHPHSSYAPAHSQRHPQSRSSPLPTGHYDTYSGSAAGYASDTTASVRLNTKSSRRFTALSIFSAFAGSSSSSNLSTPESSVPSSPGVGVRSTPDLLAVGMGGSASSSRSGSVLSLVVGGGVGGGGGGGGGRKKGRSQSSYHAPSAFSLHANALSNVNANLHRRRRRCRLRRRGGIAPLR
ncbi:hypothetical protein BDN70DRAFT_91233 [Pholiota conissans]|uniref:Uncharacterized protein n=1 Tax=Pholiota conissans TaxID=109636 RepID=A0A9P5YY03_9AGAR|nr:hypothetical protein BDN70DRAFT_91233 [Pholiota conissans]